MPATKRKKPAAKSTTCSQKEIVVTDCGPDHNPVEISKSCQNGLPNSIFFSTQDSDRVYEVQIKSGVFGSGKIKAPFWCCHPTPVFEALPGARKERFKYELKAIVGNACPKRKKGENAPPPTIIIQD